MAKTLSTMMSVPSNFDFIVCPSASIGDAGSVFERVSGSGVAQDVCGASGIDVDSVISKGSYVGRWSVGTVKDSADIAAIGALLTSADATSFADAASGADGTIGSLCGA